MVGAGLMDPAARGTRHLRETRVDIDTGLPRLALGGRDRAAGRIGAIIRFDKTCCPGSGLPRTLPAGGPRLGAGTSSGRGAYCLVDGWRTSENWPTGTRPGSAVAAAAEVRSMRSPLTMTEYRPAGRLGLYVRDFQVFSATQRAGASVLDFGGGDVSVPVCFGDPVLVDDWAGEEVPNAAVVGPRRHAVWLRFQGAVDQVNISFFPGAAGAFVDLAMPELVGRIVRPDDVWPEEFREAVDELEPLPTDQRIRGLADLLLDQLEPRREPNRQIREAVRLIRVSRGRTTVRWLAGRLDLSVSQLERSFTRHVGIGPKLLARQTRVCALAAEAARRGHPGWALLAAKYRYADQAHLVREVRDLIGLTPSGLARVGTDADFLQDALACRRRP